MALPDVMRRLLANPQTRRIDIDDPRLVAQRRALVQAKPFLRSIYLEWYGAIARELPAGREPIVEVGSGGGFLDAVIPGLITSEIQPCRHVRLVMDAQALPIASASVKAIVMTDVLHHLPDVRRFLREAARCVRPGGRIVMMEPWVSTWSSFVYPRFHHEPFRPDVREWEFPRGGPLSSSNMALPWILCVRDRVTFERQFPEWRVRSIVPLMPFRYLLSGGVSMRALMPGWTFGFWRALEGTLSRWNGRFAMFAYIVLERTGSESPP